jgi:hypothetical protein
MLHRPPECGATGFEAVYVSVDMTRSGRQDSLTYRCHVLNVENNSGGHE